MREKRKFVLWLSKVYMESTGAVYDTYKHTLLSMVHLQKAVVVDIKTEPEKLMIKSWKPLSSIFSPSRHDKVTIPGGTIHDGCICQKTSLSEQCIKCFSRKVKTRYLI